MVERTVEEDNEVARATRLREIKDRARIFIEVFGDREHPTPHGKLIFSYLNNAFNLSTSIPPNLLDDHGRVDALQTWRKMGHYDVIQWIRLQLEYKESENGNAGS